jgi:hypothetical protein
MQWILIAATVIAGVMSFFVWANYRTKKHHAAFATSDVTEAIQNALSGDYHDEWDLFLAWPINDRT